MPTFKLSDLDDSITYGGDNDMFFRQWRAPSMKPVLEKKLDRDFQNAVSKKEDFLQKRADARKKHDEKFERKFGELTRRMEHVMVSDKENKNVLRQPTANEIKKRRENLEKEYESPSSTAAMTNAKQLTARLKPRTDPLFGNNMAALKNLVIPPPEIPPTTSVFGSSVRKPLISESSNGPMTPKDNSFLNNSHETVFYQQTHNSFNLDHYNGTRPSFAFSGLNAATSTPVSKNPSKFSVGSSKISEEDDTVFEESKYVTAMESPIQKIALPPKKEQPIFNIPSFGKPEKPSIFRPAVEPVEALKEVKQEIEKETREITSNIERIESAVENGCQSKQEEIKKDGIQTMKKKLEGTSTKISEAADSSKAVDPTQRVAQTADPKDRKSLEKHNFNKKEGLTSFIRPYILFKNYIALLSTIMEEKAAYEKSADPAKRSLLKRTVTEKVTIFTQRHTSSQMRGEILDFFKSLLQKKEVEGFSIIGEAPKLQLSNEEDVHYAVFCLVEKYISLAELDDELAPTISDLISRLSGTVRRVEKVFIVMMFNKSVLLRQNPEECHKCFIDACIESDEKAIILNRESSLATLFLHVFVKNAAISLKGRRMVLDDELLWRYAESVVAHCPEIPKAVTLVFLITTICKPLMCMKETRWKALLTTIETETLPLLDQTSFAGDASSISNMKQMMTVLWS